MPLSTRWSLDDGRQRTKEYSADFEAKKFNPATVEHPNDIHHASRADGIILTNGGMMVIRLDGRWVREDVEIVERQEVEEGALYDVVWWGFNDGSIKMFV